MADPRLLNQGLLDTLSQVAGQPLPNQPMSAAEQATAPQQVAPAPAPEPTPVPAKNPLLDQIAAGHGEQAPSFGREVANMALGEIPIVGGILQKQHQADFEQEQQAKRLHALSQSVSAMPEDRQKLIADLVKQGDVHGAFKAYKDIAMNDIKTLTRDMHAEKQHQALAAALGPSIERVQDPILKQRLQALAATDPKSALIQVGQYENAQIAQGFRGRSENRAETTQRLTALKGMEKMIPDNEAGKRALDIKQAFIDKGFTPEDLNLSSKNFAAKFGIDPKEASNVKLQVTEYLNSKKTGGVLGLGASIPPELAKDPQKLLSGVENLFATPQAISEQQKTDAARQQIQQQMKELQGQVAPGRASKKGVAAQKLQITPEQAAAELKRRGK